MIVRPLEVEVLIADQLHSGDGDVGRPGRAVLGADGRADLARAMRPQVAQGQDRFMTVRPVQIESVVAHLAQRTQTESAHGQFFSLLSWTVDSPVVTLSDAPEPGGGGSG